MNKLFAILMTVLGTATALAVPVTLEGLGLASSWIDYETSTGDLPTDAWGSSDDVHADRIGIYVEFADGLSSWAVYSGITEADWGICCTVGGDYNGILPDMAEGFLSGVGMHGLNRYDLPMAWNGASNIYSANFDLDYIERNNSNFRASTSGWQSVEIALYSNAYAEIPEPGMLTMIVIGLAGMGFRRVLNK